MVIFLTLLLLVTLWIALRALARANGAAARAERLEELWRTMNREIDTLTRQAEARKGRKAGKGVAAPLLETPPISSSEPVAATTVPIESPPLPPPVPPRAAAAAVVPRPLPLSAAREAVRPRRSIDMREWLRRLHLLPPEQTASSEVSLAGWWSTRIGALLGVIAAVFFGVYVNSKTSPELRFAELLAVAAGVTFLGRGLEKKLGRYGEVLSACGLALLYVTAFGGYALPALRVFHDPITGVAAQLAAVALMTAWSWWKRDAHLAALALFLGYVSCAFADFFGVSGIARGGLATFAVMGALLYAFKGWRLPLATAMAGSFLGLLLLAAGGRLPVETLAVSVWLTGLTTAFVLIFSAALWWRRGQDGPAVFRHYLLGVAFLAALAAFGGLSFYQWEGIEQVYGAFTLVFGGMAVAIGWPLLTRSGVEAEGTGDAVLSQTLFLKASTYLALFIVTQAEGPVRSIAVTLQALGVLWTARRALSLQLWFSVAAVILWVTGHGLFWHDVREAGVMETLVYGLAATAVATLRVDWLRRARVVAISGWMSGLAGAALVGGALPASGEPSGETLLTIGAGALLTGFFGLWRKSWIPWVASLVALLGGHAIGFGLGSSPEPLEPTARWGLLGILLLTPISLWSSRNVWPRHAALPPVLSAIWVLPALSTSAVLALDFASGHAALALYAVTVFAFLATSRALMSAEGDSAEGVWRKSLWWRLIPALLAGVCVSIFAWNELPSQGAVAWALMAIAYAYLSLAYALRDPCPAAGALVPALCAWLAVAFPEEILDFPYALGADAMLTALIVVFFLGISLPIERLRPGRRPWAAMAQISGFLALYQWAGRHFELPVVWAAMAGTTCLAGLAAWRWRYEVLKWTAWVPAAYALAVSLGEFGAGIDRERFSAIWLGSALLFALWLFLERREKDRRWALAMGVLMWIGLLFAALRSLELPWVALGFAAVSGLGALLFQRRGDGVLGELAKYTAALTFATALLSLVTPVAGPAWTGLAALLPAAALVALQGWMLRRAATQTVILGAPAFVWGHAAAALLMAFLVLIHRQYGVVEVATALWGLAAIVLFLGGLFGGLRPYRFVGLSGMAACIVRVFIYDLQDTFYRIIAFAATAVLLLVVGYLYTRFRAWIEQHDLRVATEGS